MMGREDFPIEWVEPEKLAVFDLSVNPSFMWRHLCFLLIAWLVSVPSSSIARESEDAGLWTSVSGTGSLEEFARLGDRWL